MSEAIAGVTFFAPLLAFGLSLALTAWLVRARMQWAMDLPNERSLHSTPVPRTGGLAIMGGVLAGGLLVLAMGESLPWLALGIPALLLIALSLVDDRRGLSVRVRLPMHLLAALLFVLPLALAGGGVAWIGVPVLVIGVAGFANLYNFMDGANGLAGGMALFGFSAYGLALLGLPAVGGGMGDPGLAALCFALAAGAGGFLVFNLRGRIFMGDAGSVPLGFLAAAIGVQGWAAGHWPCWFPLLAFAPFALDGTLTVLKRMARGERFWEAHREHYYQRVVRMGATHGQLAIGAWTLMALCGGAAVWALGASAQAMALIFATIALLLIVLGVVIDSAWRRHSRRQ